MNKLYECPLCYTRYSDEDDALECLGDCAEQEEGRKYACPYCEEVFYYHSDAQKCAAKCWMAENNISSVQVALATRVGHCTTCANADETNTRLFPCPHRHDVEPPESCPQYSPDVRHCYAERQAARLVHMPQTAAKYAGVVDAAGKWTGMTNFDVSCLVSLPKAAKRIFVGSMCDLFHGSVTDSQLEHIMGHIGLTSANEHHTFMLLTKRPKRMRDFFANWKPYRGVTNVCLGVTVCNQQEADEKIPLLLATPAAKRFVSVEPMLGPINLGFRRTPTDRDYRGWNGDDPIDYVKKTRVEELHWIICGGETGPKARPMHPDWVRDLRDQCAAASVPFFFKGWGEWAEIHTLRCNEPGIKGKMWYNFDPDTSVCRVGKSSTGCLLDGIVHKTFPDARP